MIIKFVDRLEKKQVYRPLKFKMNQVLEITYRNILNKVSLQHDKILDQSNYRYSPNNVIRL